MVAIRSRSETRPSAPPRSDDPRRWHRDTSDAGPDRTPENAARGDADANVDVDLEAVLQTVSKLAAPASGYFAGSYASMVAAVATAWTAAIRDGLLKPAGYDSLDHAWQYELTSAGQARAHPTDTPSAPEPARHARHNSSATPPAMEGPARSRSSRRQTEQPKVHNQTCPRAALTGHMVPADRALGTSLPPAGAGSLASQQSVRDSYGQSLAPPPRPEDSGRMLCALVRNGRSSALADPSRRRGHPDRLGLEKARRSRPRPSPPIICSGTPPRTAPGAP